jgi:hypothetical protein
MIARTTVLTLACALLLVGPAYAQQAFPTPAAAGEALVGALEVRDREPQRLASVLGEDWQHYVPKGSVDREDVDAFIAGYRKQHAYKAVDASHSLLDVGVDAWTLPIPLVKRDAGWAFDLKAAEPELRARRIGHNERDALQAVLAYYDAQMEYASKERNDNGLLEYAAKFRSSEGQHDGLYWPADDKGPSPLGPRFVDASGDGEWHGYRYKILTAQGPSAPRGEYKYFFGSYMVRGFGLVAWPAKYGDSGVMSLIISHAGEVFEKDLGPDTERIASAMTVFDPDSSWTQVDPQAVASP